MAESSTAPSAAWPESDMIQHEGGRIAVTRSLSRLVVVGMALVLVTSCSSGDAKANIGTQIDAPGFAYQDSASGQRSGFDVDFYRWFATFADEPFTPAEVELTVDEREAALRDGRADFVFASYTITSRRDELIDFAGPYLETQQGVMVRADDARTVTNPSQLAGRSVCAERESTSIEELHRIDGLIPVEERTLVGCVDRLLAGRVDAVSTDMILLYGHQRRDPRLRVEPGVLFGPIQGYGIGLPPEEGTENCERVNLKIKEFIATGTWDQAFMANLGDDLPRDDFKPKNLRPCVPDTES